MNTPRRQVVALFVERSNHEWIVRDPEGNFWVLPSVEDPWEHRKPFRPTEGNDLEPVPGHYKSLLRLPF